MTLTIIFPLLPKNSKFGGFSTVIPNSSPLLRLQTCTACALRYMAMATWRDVIVIKFVGLSQGPASPLIPGITLEGLLLFY